jgi:transcriptional regulator with XRE-family HTH domain
MTTLGDIIKERCEEKGWSLRELARRADLPPATVHKVVTTEGLQPRVETIDAIADALRMSHKVLLEAAAHDSGYVTQSVDTKSGSLLMASIKELSPARQKEVAALVEAMLASDQSA